MIDAVGSVVRSTLPGLAPRMSRHRPATRSSSRQLLSMLDDDGLLIRDGDGGWVLQALPAGWPSRRRSTRFSSARIDRLAAEDRARPRPRRP